MDTNDNTTTSTAMPSVASGSEAVEHQGTGTQKNLFTTLRRMERKTMAHIVRGIACALGGVLYGVGNKAQRGDG